MTNEPKPLIFTFLTENPLFVFQIDIIYYMNLVAEKSETAANKYQKPYETVTLSFKLELAELVTQILYNMYKLKSLGKLLIQVILEELLVTKKKYEE